MKKTWNLVESKKTPGTVNWHQEKKQEEGFGEYKFVLYRHESKSGAKPENYRIET